MADQLNFKRISSFDFANMVPDSHTFYILTDVPEPEEAGLYENDVMTRDWQSLTTDRIVDIGKAWMETILIPYTNQYTQGKGVKSNYSYDTDINYSSDYLVGKLVLSDTINELSSVSFRCCLKLTEVYIPDGISLPTELFWGCTSLRKVRFPSDITILPSGCFHSCDIKSIGPIGSGADYEILPQFTELDSYCFMGNHNLESVVIPDTVEVVGYNAFQYYYMLGYGSKRTKLSSITLGSGVKVVRSQAFDGACTTEITYKGTMEQWSQVNFSNSYVYPYYGAPDRLETTIQTIHCLDGDVNLN